jgi:hypothetical protein
MHICIIVNASSEHPPLHPHCFTRGLLNLKWSHFTVAQNTVIIAQSSSEHGAFILPTAESPNVSSRYEFDIPDQPDLFRLCFYVK